MAGKWRCGDCKLWFKYPLRPIRLRASFWYGLPIVRGGVNNNVSTGATVYCPECMGGSNDIKQAMPGTQTAASHRGGG